MVAAPLSERRHPAIVTSLAAVRHQRRQLRRLHGLVDAVIAQRRAERQPLADEIRELQARAEREMPARGLYWQHVGSLPFR